MNIRNVMALVIAGWVLTGATAIAADAQKTTSAPNAIFASTTYNFPTVVEGVVVEHEFTVKNFGTADLKVEKVKTG
jgi:hypothetical protein